MAFMRVKDLYFLTVLLLIRVVRLPGSVALRNRLVDLLGSLAFRRSEKKRRRSLYGLEAGLGPSLEGTEKEQIVRASFRMFWKDAFAILPFPEESRTFDDIPIEGMELLEAALEKKRGLILLESNSFGNRLFAKQVLHRRGYPVVQVHARNHLHGLRNEGLGRSWLREKVLSPAFERWEREFVSEVVYLPEDNSLAFTRTLQRLLSKNSIVCSAGDGNRGQRLVKVPFLNRARTFATGMFSLSRVSGAPVMPLLCYEDGDLQTRITIGPLISMDCNGGDRSATEVALSEYVRVLEGQIRRYPEQYRHWHF